MTSSAQEIAAEIRARIETGRLRPGDRVPSARQITREWGVAIATATKALAALQAQGLVSSVVGVGTVVNDHPRGTVSDSPQGMVESDRPQGMAAAAANHAAPATTRGAESELTRERITRTAVAIADAEGLSAVTMRRLATELDSAVMSLYRHVAGKDELMTLMTDHIFGELSLPDPAPPGWRPRLEAVARLQWALVKRHPWLPSAMSLTRPLMVPRGMAMTEANMRVLHEMGFDPPTSLYVTVALAGLMLGVGTTLQMEADAQRETGMTSNEWMTATAEAFMAIDAPSRFPLLAEASAIPGFDLLLDDVFETGLALMLDGVAQRIAPGSPAPSGSAARKRR